MDKLTQIKKEQVDKQLTDFSKTFMKNFIKKSDKIKLKDSKELLTDLVGYLINQQFDNYIVKVENFMNKKNEFIKESFKVGDKVQLRRKNNKKSTIEKIFNGVYNNKTGKAIKYLDVKFKDGKVREDLSQISKN